MSFKELSMLHSYERQKMHETVITVFFENCEKELCILCFSWPKGFQTYSFHACPNIPADKYTYGLLTQMITNMRFKAQERLFFWYILTNWA